MSKTEPTGSGDQPPPIHKQEEPGYLERPPRVVKDLTGRVEGHEEKVPHAYIYTDAPFKSKVSTAWQEGKFLAVVRLVFYTAGLVLGVVQRPELRMQPWPPEEGQQPADTIPEGKNTVAAELMVLSAQGKSEDSPEVQKQLKALFGDEEKQLQKEWKGTSTKDARTQASFLEKVERRRQTIQALDDVPYAETMQEERLDQLQALRKEVCDQLLGNEVTFEARNQTLQALSDSFKALTIEENRLSAMDLKGAVAEARNERTRALKSFKEQIISQLDQGVQESERVLRDAIPSEVEQAAQRLAGLNQSLSQAREEERVKSEAYDTVSTALEKIEEEQRQIPDKLRRLEKERQRKFDDVVQPKVEAWIEENTQMHESLTSLIAENDRYTLLNKIKQGLVTEPGFFGRTVTRKLTGDEERDYKALADGAIKRQEAIADQEKAIAERKKEIDAEISQLERTQVGKFFDQEIADLKSRQREIAGRTQELQAQKEAAGHALTAAAARIESLQQEQKAEQKAIEAGVKKLRPQILEVARRRVYSAALRAYNSQRQRDTVDQFIWSYAQQQSSALATALIRDFPTLSLTQAQAEDYFTINSLFIR